MFLLQQQQNKHAKMYCFVSAKMFWFCLNLTKKVDLSDAKVFFRWKQVNFINCSSHIWSRWEQVKDARSSVIAWPFWITSHRKNSNSTRIFILNNAFKTILNKIKCKRKNELYRVFYKAIFVAECFHQENLTCFITQ